MANITARRPLFYLLGDSLTQMGGQMYDEGWGILLQHEYERSADFVNRGLGGYDTRMFLTHGMPVLREELRSVYKPAFITVWFGANDAALVDGPSNKQHVPLDDYKKNLVAILQELHELVPEAKILLISPPPVDDAKRREIGEELAGEKLTGPLDRTNEQAGRYANACGDVAAQVEGVTLLDMHAYLMETYPNDVERARLLSDGLHFTKEGNRVVFNQIKAYAEKLLSPKTLETWQLPNYDQLM